MAAAIQKYTLLISGALIITVSHHLLVIAAFAACMIIFVFPCFLLGTVTPSLVKYTVGSLEESGTTVGMLGAFNTIGTFLPTFVTIPAVGTAITFLIFSGVLLILALIYFISCRRRKTACIVCSILFCACAVTGNSSHFAFWESDLVYEGESIYNYLQVRETDEQVILSTNVLFGVQSVLGMGSGTYDGRAYLAAVDKKYDVIMVDAYQDITIPFQMSSAEFFRMVREHLNEDGVMVVNMNMRTDTEVGINTWLSDTIASVYPHVRTDPRQDR